jgi:ribose transport system substrate-binding protein
MASTTRYRGVRRWAPIAAALALVLAACGTGSGSPSTASSAGSDSSAAAIPDEVRENVEQFMGLPEFTAPGPEIDVSSLEGMSMFLIPLVPNPFNQSIEETMQEIADDVGIELTIYANQGQASQWVQGMNAAIAADPDIIVLNTAPDPRLLQPQLEEAAAAGIPVLVTHFYDDSSPEPPDCDGCAAGVTALVTAPFYVAGEAAANWVILDSGGTAHTLIIGAEDALPSPGTIDKIKETFDNNCPACEYTVINIPIADWNTKTQGEVQSALTANPDITYVYPLYDAMVAGAVPAVETVGRADEVKVLSYNGSPYVLEFIQQGNIAAMDVGEDTVGIGYANMDQAFRILLGEPTVPQRTPIRIFDSTNVDEAGTPPTVGTGYGNALAEGFTQLWGLGN